MKLTLPPRERNAALNELQRDWVHSPRGVDRQSSLADLGVIASRLTHEIRNPLMAMRLQASLAADKLASGLEEDLREAAEQLDALRAEITRLERLAEAFLEYGRPPAANVERVVLSAFLRECLPLLEAECAPGGIEVTLRVGPAAEDAGVLVDRAQLKQVVLNLTRNAMAAMCGGGRLALSCHTRGRKRIGVSLRDTGCGIPADKLGSIFEPFYSTRADGNGLGLAICRQIIEAAGGCIGVESEVGRGTRFEIVFPQAL